MPRKRTRCIKTLRRILCKFSAVDEDVDAGAWGQFFRGCNTPDLTAEEIKFCAQIEDGSMQKAEATRLIANLDPSTTFYVRVEWMQLLAALVAVFRDEAERTAPRPTRKIWQLLHTATAADRTEWYFNNFRLRHSFPRQRLSLLPVGTTSNESLHHEVNCWFRETQKIHQSSLNMKLRILRLGKLVTHSAAMYHQTIRQVNQAVVLARASGHRLWSPAQWSDWCRELAQEGPTQKADLPFERSRKS